MDGADHLGDVGGSHLAVDLSLSSAFTPLQRIVLTANGNLQRILSAYHNRAVHDLRGLGGKQSFSLLEVSKNATTFSRTYTLANAHIMCHVEEVLPLNLFDDDFFARAPDWHPDAALQ
ncbi:hypothetical protein JL722_5012 [Aureococcus anophagefferens]|nr:hypothetical protein JL722_5012 [Aureococcus anophagefferens]